MHAQARAGAHAHTFAWNNAALLHIKANKARAPRSCNDAEKGCSSRNVNRVPCLKAAEGTVHGVTCRFVGSCLRCTRIRQSNCLVFALRQAFAQHTHRVESGLQSV